MMILSMHFFFSSKYHQKQSVAEKMQTRQSKNKVCKTR